VRRALSAFALVAAVAAVLAGSAFATVVHYYGPEWVMNPWQTAQTSGFTNRDYNKMFRPAGTYAAVQYNDTSDQWIAGTAGYQNPVELGASGQYARALCGNLIDDFIYPTTCNTTS
jgi:hypothetical protein